MEKPTDIKKEIREALKNILITYKDSRDEIEAYKYDSSIGRFVREFEHIKSKMIYLIWVCFRSQGLILQQMVMHVFTDLNMNAIREYLVPMYNYVRPMDQIGKTGLTGLCGRIKELNANRNTLIHHHHLDSPFLPNDSGKKAQIGFSFKLKRSSQGIGVQAQTYTTSNIEANTNYALDVQHWLDQCSERLGRNEDISTLLDEFNQISVPDMGKRTYIKPDGNS